MLRAISRKILRGSIPTITCVPVKEDHHIHYLVGVRIFSQLRADECSRAYPIILPTNFNYDQWY